MIVGRDTRPWAWKTPSTPSRRKAAAARAVPTAPQPVRGENHGQARLTEAQVVELRRRYAAGGVTQRVLAEELGVTPRAIALIVRGQRWRHLEGGPSAPR